MPGAPERWSIGVDVGGTFVDIAAASSRGALKSAKRARDEQGAAESVLHALDEFVRREGIRPDATDRLLHGTTVATNALLERREPPVGVLLTHGFRDLLALGRQGRRDLYARFVARQTPVDVFPDRMRFEVDGRIDASGRELAPLNESDIAKAGAALVSCGASALAISFLHAHVNPAHERRAREILARIAPSLRISLSSEVDPRPREYERALTAALDAYVKAAVAGYLEALAKGVTERGYPVPLLMQAIGGVARVQACVERPLALAMSGPAAAVSGARALLDAETRAGLAVTMDVGGTTTDLALLEAGRQRFAEELAIGDLRLRLRSVEVTSIAVGGGSVVRVNAAGGLRVGPESTGAFPGPAAFARGGRRSTLADAFAVAGLLPATLAGGLALDRTLAVAAVRRDAAEPLGAALEEAAWSIIDVANAQLAEAVKQVALARGHDPRDATLVAAGGGGGLHAAEVATRVGIRRVLIPPGTGVIAAYGLLSCPALTLFERALDTPLDSARLAPAVRGLLDDASKAEPLDGYGPQALEAFVDVCYAGQEFSLEVPYDPEVDTSQQLANRFDEEHRRVRGQAFEGRRRVRGMRIVVRQPAAGNPLPRTRPASAGQDATRKVFIPAGTDCPVLARGALSGRGAGPLLIDGEDATIWIPAGWLWHALDGGGVLLEPA